MSGTLDSTDSGSITQGVSHLAIAVPDLAAVDGWRNLVPILDEWDYTSDDQGLESKCLKPHYLNLLRG